MAILRLRIGNGIEVQLGQEEAETYDWYDFVLDCCGENGDKFEEDGEVDLVINRVSFCTFAVSVLVTREGTYG